MTNPAQEQEQEQEVNRGRPGAAANALHLLFREIEETRQNGIPERVIVSVESIPIWGGERNECMHVVRFPPTGTQQHRRAFVVTEEQLARHFELVTPAVFRMVGFGAIYDRPTPAQRKLDEQE